jgi:hypothetical protein
VDLWSIILKLSIITSVIVLVFGETTNGMGQRSRRAGKSMQTNVGDGFDFAFAWWLEQDCEILEYLKDELFVECFYKHFYE